MSRVENNKVLLIREWSIHVSCNIYKAKSSSILYQLLLLFYVGSERIKIKQH